MWENRLEALQPGGGALAHLLKGLCFLLLAKGEQFVWANLIDNKASFYCLTRVSFIFFSTLKQLPFPAVHTPSVSPALHRFPFFWEMVGEH